MKAEKIQKTLEALGGARAPAFFSALLERTGYFFLGNVSRERILSVFLYASFLVPYLALTLPRLHLPGLPLDEVLSVMFLFGEFRHLSLRIGGVSLPLGLVDYHAGMECYVFFPFVRLLGSTPEAIRLCSVLFGALTLVAVYVSCRTFFRDVRVAWGAAFFLSTFSPYVTGTRFGTYHAGIPLFFQTVVLLCLVHFIASDRAGWLYCAAFFQGASASCRGWFLFSMVSLWVSFFILFPKPFLSRFRASLRVPLLCVALFLAGGFPLTLYVVVHPRYLISSIAERFPRTENYDNLDYRKNLVGRFDQFFDVWSYDEFLAEAFPGSAERPKGKKTFWKGVMACGFLWLVAAIVLRLRRLTFPQKALFLLYPLFLFSLSPFTLSWPRENHLFPLIPLLAIMVVLAGVSLTDVLLRKLGAASRMAVILAALVFVRVGDPPLIQARLKTMKGASPYYTDAIYDLKDWIVTHPLRGPLVVDVGIGTPLQYLMGRTFSFEKFDPRGDIPAALMDGPAHLIAHSPENTPRSFLYDMYFDLDDFRGFGDGKRIKRFFNSGGEPMIDVYELEAGVRGLMGFYDRHPRYAVPDRYFSVQTYRSRS